MAKNASVGKSKAQGWGKKTGKGNLPGSKPSKGK